MEVRIVGGEQRPGKPVSRTERLRGGLARLPPRASRGREQTQSGWAGVEKCRPVAVGEKL